MSEITRIFDTFVAPATVGFGVVNSELALRLRILRLVNVLGISQKVIAGRMNMSPSRFSKWLRGVEGVNEPGITSAEGFYRYVEQIRAEADFDPLKLPPEEQERLQAEAQSRETEHTARGKVRAHTRTVEQKRSGKKVAKT